MNDLSKVRSVVARFFQVTEAEVNEGFVFPPHRIQGSLGRTTFHSAIKRIAQVDLPSAFTAKTFGELIQGEALPAGVSIPTSKATSIPPVAMTAPPAISKSAASLGAFQLQTGVDIASLDELPPAESPALETFIAENFSAAEAAYARQQPDPRVTLLGLWAAKEATLKCGWVGSLKIHEIEVVHGEQGQPRIQISTIQRAGTARATLGSPGQHSVSISHAGSFAIAICVRVNA